MKSDLILHLDLDGVLTDFDAGFKKLSGGLDPEHYREKHGRHAESELFYQQGEKFWSELGWIYGGKELYDFALKTFQVVRILSSAGTGKDWKRFKEVQNGKLKWIQSNLTGMEKRNVLIVPFNTLKARHSGADRILVDDKQVNIKMWINKGGTGLLHHYSVYQSTIQHLTDLASGKPLPIKLTEILASL